MHLFSSGKTRCLSALVLWIAVACAFTACGGGGSSSSTTQNPAPPSSNPAPTVTSVSPPSGTAGASAATITVNGSGFIQNSTVEWNQSSRSTTFVSSTQLQVAVTAADLATAGTAQITVTNPAPGGGTSSAVSFTVNNPAPVISTLSQSSAIAGSSALTLTITGTGFVSGSTVQWNQSNRVTTFVSATQLQITVSAADIAAGGAEQITVTNGAPGGGTSAAITFTVNNPVPQVASVSPMTLTTDDSGTTFTVNGTGFVPNSTVTINGANRTTTFVSSTQLQAQLVASDVAAVGSLQVSVSNPTPGGGAGTAAALTIVYPVPSVSSLSPAAVSAGGPAFTLTVNGSGFQPTSGVKLNGATRVATFVSSSILQVNINAADIINQGSIAITVVTGTPGGGTSSAVNLVVGSFVVPTLASANPTSITVDSPTTFVSLQGTGFTQFSTIQVNGSSLPIGGFNPTFLSFQLPSTSLTSVGTLSITVSNPGTAASNAVTINVTPNPVPTLNSLSPNSVAVGSAGFTLTLFGSNFSQNSVIQWNGSPRTTTFLAPSELTTTIAATDVQSLGNNLVTVVNPAPGGGPSSPVALTTFLALPANDLVYNPTTQLLYASIPSSAGPALGNSVLPIDPYTGNLGNPIFVGSEPTRLALSNDGSVAWVGLNGTSAVREVNLNTQTAGLQIGLGNGGPFSNPNVASALSVMPGNPNTVAVAVSNFPSNLITVYDSGIARAKTSPGINTCCSNLNDLIFDPTGATLYELDGAYGSLTVDSTGITSATSLNPNANGSAMKIDNGSAYLNNGLILNAATGVQQGVFSVAQGQNASGPVAPDSTLGRAFVLVNPNFSQQFQINAYDLATFVLKGSFPVGGVNTFTTTPHSMVRWGQDGVAFVTGTQIYILRSPLVKDLTSSLADLNVTASAPATANTGDNVTFTLTVTNAGPVTASPAILTDNIPSGSALVSSTPSQGTCSQGAVIRCNLGNINSGSSATVTIVVTALASGTLSNNATVAAPQGDPNTNDNTVVSTVTVSGNQNNASPSIMSISPAFVQAGSSTFTLTVNGSGFGSGSDVFLNSTSLPTSFVNSTQLTATVDASNVAALGWATITVNNPSPGGGTSSGSPLSIYQVVSLDVNRMKFDPYTRKIYATIPATATQVTGNSVAAIDPTTGSIGAPLNIGSNPNAMAESQDGKLLYVGIDGALSLTSIDLTSQVQGLVYPIAVTSGTASTPSTATDLAVLPGNDNTLAIATSASGVGIFDISGASLTARTNLNSGTAVAFPNASGLYTFSGQQLLRFTVGANGLTRIDATNLNGFTGPFALTNGLVYGTNGGIADPTATPPAMIAQLNVSSALGSSFSVQGEAVAPDPTSNRVFALGQSFSSSAPVLLAYDDTIFDLTNSQQFAGLSQGTDLVRWGRDGLAWHSTPSFGNNTPGNGQVVLVRGPFVLPEWLTANPTPTLTTISPSSIAAEVPGNLANLTLSVTGSNFVPGAVVLWNGAERSTAYVDSAHLTVAIPASDLTQSGTATLVVNNPGSSNSGSVTFTIN